MAKEISKIAKELCILSSLNDVLEKIEKHPELNEKQKEDFSKIVNKFYQTKKDGDALTSQQESVLYPDKIIEQAFTFQRNTINFKILFPSHAEFKNNLWSKNPQENENYIVSSTKKMIEDLWTLFLNKTITKDELANFSNTFPLMERKILNSKIITRYKTRWEFNNTFAGKQKSNFVFLKNSKNLAPFKLDIDHNFDFSFVVVTVLPN